MTSAPDSLLPDTDLARSLLAQVFAEESASMANHSVRTYLFAIEYAARNDFVAGTDYDDRLLFAGCVLHDAGLTAHGNGEHRFEVDGADYAAKILADHDFSADEQRAVWESIVLHTSPDIAERWNTLTLLVRSGVGTDFGRGMELVPRARLDAIHAAYPRLEMEHTITNEILAQAVDRPAKAPRNSFADILVFEREARGVTRMELGAIRS